MGIDFTASKNEDDLTDEHYAKWSYSGFSDFRERLADEINIDLNAMEGFGGEDLWDEIDDDIKPLLNHSDCDGILTPAECKQVAPRLEQIVAQWSDTSTDGYDKDNALALARLMHFCVDNQADLIFC